MSNAEQKANLKSLEKDVVKLTKLVNKMQITAEAFREQPWISVDNALRPISAPLLSLKLRIIELGKFINKERK